LLGDLRAIEGYVYVETRQLSALRTRRPLQRLDFHRGSQPFDKILNVNSASDLSVQAEFLNDGLQACPAEDLLFHDARR